MESSRQEGLLPPSSATFPPVLEGDWRRKLSLPKFQVYHGLASSIHRSVLAGFLITLGIATLFVLILSYSYKTYPSFPIPAFIQGLLVSLAGASAGYFFILRSLVKPLHSIQEVEKRLAEAAKTDHCVPVSKEGSESTEMDSLVQAYNGLTQRLREKEIQQLQIHSKVFHNLRSPLASIVGYAGLLSDPTLGQDIKYLETAQDVIVNQGRSISRIIENCSTVVSLEAVQPKTETTPFRLDRLVEAIIVEVREQTQRDLRYENDIGEVRVAGDEFDLRTALVHLIDNGLKYSQPDQPVQIRIQLADKPGWIDISVEDHGIGIGEADVPVLFSRFGRIRNAQNQEIHGSGLGLYIVKIITEQHHGKIFVRSKPGEGSTFTLRFPLQKP